jgi:O-antigen ligase
MLKFSLPTVDRRRAEQLALAGAAVAIGILTALFKFGEHFGLVALLAISVLGVMFAFLFPIWLQALLLVIVIPTTDAQLAQTPLFVPGTQLSISYLDPLLFIIFGLWLIRLITGQQHIYRNPLNAPLALFLITVVLAAIIGLVTGARPGDVWIGLRPALMYFLAFVTASSLTSGRQARRLIGLIIGTVFVVAVWGIYLSITGRGTPISTEFGTVGLRNFQGAQSVYLVIGLMCALGIVMFVHRRWVRLSLVIVATITGAAVLASFVRGNWIGALVGLIALIALLPAYTRVRFVATTSLILSTLLVLVSAIIFLYPQGTPILDVARERLLSIVNPSASTQYTYDAAESRAFELNSGLPQIIASPILGHGYGHYFTVDFVRGEPTLVRGFHNSYLTVAYTNGLVGLAAFLWLSGAFLVYCWHLSRKMPPNLERGMVIGLAAAYTAVLIASIVNFYLFDTVNVPPFMGIAVGMVLFLGRKHKLNTVS